MAAAWWWNRATASWRWRTCWKVEDNLNFLGVGGGMCCPLPQLRENGDKLI
jgi:hypothetical protein